MNYHTLSDFRSEQGEVLSALITQLLALLMKGNLIDLSRTAQDGTRVRASAGAGSFRRPARVRPRRPWLAASFAARTRQEDVCEVARRGASVNVQFASGRQIAVPNSLFNHKLE